MATRPLPEELGTHAPFHELRPFTREDLREYATRWLNDQADQFTAACERAHLDTLARTPLIASMLCQLYAADRLAARYQIPRDIEAVTQAARTARENLPETIDYLAHSASTATRARPPPSPPHFPARPSPNCSGVSPPPRPAKPSTASPVVSA